MTALARDRADFEQDAASKKKKSKKGQLLFSNAMRGGMPNDP